jgi:hypothetical protein
MSRFFESIIFFDVRIRKIGKEQLLLKKLVIFLIMKKPFFVHFLKIEK